MNQQQCSAFAPMIGAKASEKKMNKLILSYSRATMLKNSEIHKKIKLQDKFFYKIAQHSIDNYNKTQ